MKARLTRLGASLVVATAAAALPAGAQAAAKVGERISITACVYPGVTANCLMVNGADGTIYDITRVTPRPRSMRRMIWLRGTVTDRPGICNQGIVLDRIRWTRTRQKCPN